MSHVTARAKRWFKRGALTVTCLTLTGMVFVGYHTSDSQVALSAMWSFCAPR